MSSLYSKDLYSVRMWGIPVATVEMYGTDSTYNDIPARFVYFSTKTSPLTSKIFFVDNQYTLWVDPIDHRTLSFQKSTIQPGVVNSLATEMMNNNIYYQSTDIPIPADTFTIFSLLDFIRYHRFKEPFLCNIEREGYIFPSKLIPVSTDHNYVRYQLDIDINFPQKHPPVVEHTDIFTWALFKEGVSRQIDMNYHSNQIEACVFTSGVIRLSAKLENE